MTKSMSDVTLSMTPAIFISIMVVDRLWGSLVQKIEYEILPASIL